MTDIAALFTIPRYSLLSRGPTKKSRSFYLHGMTKKFKEMIEGTERNFRESWDAYTHSPGDTEYKMSDIQNPHQPFLVLTKE